MIAFNLLGSGVFLLFGMIARRGAWTAVGGDPVPQALVITGIVVAFSATALAVALLLRLFKETGEATLDPDDVQLGAATRTQRVVMLSCGHRRRRDDDAGWRLV